MCPRCIDCDDVDTFAKIATNRHKKGAPVPSVAATSIHLGIFFTCAKVPAVRVLPPMAPRVNSSWDAGTFFAGTFRQERERWHICTQSATRGHLSKTHFSKCIRGPHIGHLFPMSHTGRAPGGAEPSDWSAAPEPQKSARVGGAGGGRSLSIGPTLPAGTFPAPQKVPASPTLKKHVWKALHSRERGHLFSGH